MEMDAKTTVMTPPRISNPIQFSYCPPDNIFMAAASCRSDPLTPSISKPASLASSPNKNSNIPSTTNPPTVHNVVLSPCAACKILRRRCVENCVLAPYFPPSDPLKFTIAHRVFGAANIIKFLQEIPDGQRADAVSSMVYEANARVRNPVYGSAGAICQLQKQLSELQAQLAKTQAELANIQHQNSNLIGLLCRNMTNTQCSQEPNSQLVPYIDTTCFLDDLGTTWEPLWA